MESRLSQIKARLQKAPPYDKGMFCTLEGMEFLWSAKSDIEFLLNEVERLNKIKDVILKNYDDDKRLLEKKLAKAIEGLNSYRDAAFEIHGEVYAVGSVAKETLREIEGINKN